MAAFSQNIVIPVSVFFLYKSVPTLPFSMLMDMSRKGMELCGAKSHVFSWASDEGVVWFIVNFNIG